MGDVRLSSPRVVVVRDGQPDLEIQTTNPDLVAWDLTRAKQRPMWPKFDEAPFLWLTFLAWHGARRTGAIPVAMTFERWRDEVLDVSAVEDEEPDAGNPTQQAAAPD